MKNARNANFEKNMQPFTLEELNVRISKPEDDFENGRFKKTSELISKYSKS